MRNLLLLFVNLEYLFFLNYGDNFCTHPFNLLLSYRSSLSACLELREDVA